MITNTGKEIVAKYLLGTAPAYASYIALGCGTKPRPLINSISLADSSTNIITVPSTDGLWVGAKIAITSQEMIEVSDQGTVGAVSGTGPWTTTITLTSVGATTAGIQVGHKITAVASVGSLGTGGVCTVTAIGSATQIGVTVTGGTTPIAGSITDINFGTGKLSTSADTIVTAITSGTTFTVDPSPLISLLDATISIQTDPSTQVLDFEMFRIPITSRGYIKDTTTNTATNKIILTAELPTEERYEISEVGIFSAGSNSSAGSSDSKTITAFSGRENWQFNTGTTLSAPVDLPNPTFPNIVDSNFNFITTQDSFQMTADNAVFFNSTHRPQRYERCRYLNNIYMLRGNTALLTGSAGSFVKESGTKFLQITNQSVDLSRNSTSDLLKVAFALVAVTDAGSIVPEKIKIMVEFANGDGTQYARLEEQLYKLNYTDNRYIVVVKRLDELNYSTTFDWQQVSVIRIYTSTIDYVATTNKQSNGTVVTLTTASHGIPVNASITNVTATGGVITYTATNTFIPGDIVTISGVTPSAYNLSNVTVTESNGTTFKVVNPATGTSSISGTISGTATTTTITGISSTAGLVPGATVTKVSGAGAFGGTTTITSIDSASQITITSTTTNTAGAIVFSAAGGGTAIIQNAKVTVSGVNEANTGFDGTFTLSSVPSSTQISYASTSTVIGLTGVVGNVDIYRPNYYIALDAIRFDNVSTNNPLYGMTGYSIIQNTDAETVIKGASTSNYIEYRFILDVT